MPQVDIRENFTVIVDEDQVGLLSNFTWQKSVSTKPNCVKIYAYGYPKGDSKSKRLGLHHLVLGPGDGLVDHINGNGLDNRRENLRRCSASQNSQNSRRFHGLSGFKGVTKHYDGRWRARIKVDGRNKNLGCFGTPIEAARAYDVAALAHYGEFALTNGQIMKLEN